VPHSDGNGSFSGVYALAQDITERARSEEAFRRQLEQLAHASRVLTLGELAAAIAHEVNQPLTAILSTAQAALRLHVPSDPNAEEVGQALSDIAASARRGGDIVWKLQDLVRKGGSTRERIDVNGAIRGLEPLLHAGAIESDVRVVWDLDPGLREVEADLIQIQQVVLNLARNAFDAMKPVPRAARHLHLRTALRDSEVVVEVADSGPPVGDEAFSRLFKPFFSTKPEGLGMGLSICRSIVESHGGRIIGERNPGGGLTVRFTIPLPSAAAGIGA
jgi:C4-dicarboxylate-specific signal transduction histidine kinase